MEKCLSAERTQKPGRPDVYSDAAAKGPISSDKMQKTIDKLKQKINNKDPISRCFRRG